MNSLTRALHWTVLLGAIAASVCVLLQWRDVHELRSQNAAARAPTESTVSASASTEDTTKAGAEDLDRLRAENKDLLKLRNQVRQLRSQLPELAAARLEN